MQVSVWRRGMKMRPELEIEAISSVIRNEKALVFALLTFAPPKMIKSLFGFCKI